MFQIVPSSLSVAFPVVGLEIRHEAVAGRVTELAQCGRRFCS